MSERQKGMGMLLFSMVVFGTIGLFRRGIPLDSGVIAWVRAAVGTAFLLVYLKIRGKKIDWAAIRKNAPLLLFSGAIMGVNWILLFEAYRYTSVSAATVCYYMAPVLVILASPFVSGERLTLRRTLCAAAAMLGVVLVSGVLQGGMTGMRGVALALGAAVLYAGVVLINKSIRGMQSIDRTVMQLAAAAAALAPYVLLTAKAPQEPVTAGAWGLLLLVGVVHTGVCYACYFGSIGLVDVQTAAIFSYIDPVVAILLSWAVLKETMTPGMLAGVALVLGSAAVSELLPEKKQGAL